MKKNYLFIVCFLIASHALAQQQLFKLVKENYRVNPFAGNIASFIKTFVEDPDLLNKKIVEKTDTSLYFVKGNYEVFNPFIFKAKKVDVIFAESSDKVNVGDKLINISFYSYQLIVYTDDNEAYRKLILKQYQQLKKRLRKDLPKSDIVSLKGVQNIEDGEISNYFLGNEAAYPATVSWQTLSSSKQLALTILIRLTNVENRFVPYGTSWYVFNNSY